MKENFQACLKLVLISEGGKVNDPRDKGGRTNWGITQRTYDSFRYRKHLPLRNVYKAAVKEMEEIYRTQYWDAVDGDRLPLGHDYTVFDAAVNSGVARAQQWAARASKDKSFIKAYANIRLRFLRGLQRWRYFGKGWGIRVRNVEKASLKMAGL